MSQDGNTYNGERPNKWRRLTKAGPVVSRRWGRYVAVTMGRRSGRVIARWRIRRKERLHEQALIEAHKTIIDAYRGAERLKLVHSMTVFRLPLFLLTACRDIAAIKLDLLTSRNWWLRKLLARNVALMMYELDMSKVTGTDFRAALNYVAPPRQFQRELNVNLENLKTVQAELKGEFEEIRQNTIAHRDPDAMRQYRLIRNIDEIAVVKRTGAFFQAAEPIIEQIIELTRIASEMRHILNQYIGKKVFKKKRWHCVK